MLSCLVVSVMVVIVPDNAVIVLPAGELIIAGRFPVDLCLQVFCRSKLPLHRNLCSSLLAMEDNNRPNNQRTGERNSSGFLEAGSLSSSLLPGVAVLSPSLVRAAPGHGLSWMYSSP